MSRRKQAKPQHVNFTNTGLPSEALVKSKAEIAQVLRPDLLDEAPCLEDAKEQKESNEREPSLTQSDCATTLTEHSLPELNDKNKNESDNKDLNLNLVISKADESLDNMMEPSTGLCKDEDRRYIFNSAELGAVHSGRFAPAPHNQLYPKFSVCLPTAQRHPDKVNYSSTQDRESDENMEELRDEEAKKEDVKISSTEQGELRDNIVTTGPKNEGAEMYGCSRCGENFTLLGDFVQHKKTDCSTQQSPVSHEAMQPQEYDESDMQNEVNTSSQNYVINSDVIMTEASDHYAELPVAKHASHEAFDDHHSSREENSDDDTDQDRTTGSVMLESMNGTRVAMSQTMSGLDDSEVGLDSQLDPYPGSSNSSPAREDLPSTPEEENEKESNDSPAMDQYEEDRQVHDNDEKYTRNDAEKIQKEILAAGAMAHTIQNMTSFASQQNGILTGDGPLQDKPEISAIKNQVRMIQQQQAYQVQMLSFLQWQLALASSNPQAAMAAAAAATARNATMPNNLGLNPPLPPQLLSAAGNFSGGGLMPQMMAAMAMNNLQNATSGGTEMSELAKARLMMTMHQNSTENAQNFRSMFSRSLADQESMMHGEQEQRYQLKEERDIVGEGESERNQRESKSVKEEERDLSKSPVSGTQSEKCEQVSKSDSGYDEDGKAGSHTNGGNYADDSSSSHGSQEEGELRDGMLKATAEEHRHRCRFCHKVFGSDSALQIHIRSHTGERPFKCNICGNRFTTKGNLKVHFMRHKSKYPHIPMNSQPVPEYLDHVPTSNGVPYGMSILPEKAVLERPRLHGNPSIHINPHQAAQREQVPPGVVSLFMPHLNVMQGNSDSMPRPDLSSSMPSADVASALQAQLMQRRREEYLASQWNNEESKTSPRANETSDRAESKNPMSMLQAAMLPFLPGFAARQQLENLPPHLRYLLPHHLQALQAQSAMMGNNEDNNHLTARLLAGTGSGPQDSPSLQKPIQHQRNDMNDVGLSDIDKMAPLGLHNRPMMTPSSETSKLQRLVENIDRGRILQKNECHICHRVLSCQSALKLHYRTHTGERPYKCDLCSRAFTTRGNLRTHYSSVHRQTMRTIAQGGSHASRTSPPGGSFPCPLCQSSFREAVEFQHHMQMHAMVQAQQQQQQQRISQEQDRHVSSPPSAVDLSGKIENRQEATKEYHQVKSEMAEGRVTESPTYGHKEESSEPRIKEEHVENRRNSVEMEMKSEEKEDNPEQDDRSSISARGNAPSERSNSPNDVAGHDSEVRNTLALDLSSPDDRTKDVRSRESSDDLTMPTPYSNNPLDSLAALSNLSASAIMPQHTGSMHDHQLAALSRARAGRLTICEICEKTFSCQSALEIHLRTHTKERPFMCKICQRTFTTKGNLKQHLLTHNITDIPEDMLEPMSSPVEQNSSSNNSPSSSPTPTAPFVLKRPADVHDLSGPPSKRSFPRHWCHICQKQFSSASSLQIHNRTHTGEKPFACSVCGRAFTTKGNLKVHMGTHVWGAGGSRRGRRISMDNPLISPWMKNMRPRAPQPGMILPTSGHVTDPAALYQQYAAIANGLLNAKQDVASRLMLNNGHPASNSASSPASSSGSPLPSNDVTSPQNRVNGAGMANASMSAATEWFLKAYQRTQEQVN